MDSTEHKVKELCARLLEANDEEFQAALTELRTFLRSHSEILQNAALASILGLQADDSNEEEALSI